MQLASIALVHPAAIVRGAWELDPIQVEYLKRAKEYVAEECDPHDLWTLPPTAISYPTLDDLREFSSNPAALAGGLAIDIEAAGSHLVCVGLTRVSDLHYLCLRFRNPGGGLYWPTFSALYEAVEWLDHLLADPSIPKFFHNGQAYDVPELVKFTYRNGSWHGFHIEGFTEGGGLDTMLVQLTALAGFPKGLQFCATLHLGFPLWKTLVTEDDEVEGKG